MLEELCRELRNWFEYEKLFDVFEIRDGSIDLTGKAQEGQYFRIVGSVFNDGVYQYPVQGLTEETFDGAVWLMAVPPAVITLAAEIGAWVGKYSEIVVSPYTSESVPNYSYSKATGTAAGGQPTPITWQATFADKLNKWRKI